MKKRLLALLCVTAMALSLVACGGSKEAATTTEKAETTESSAKEESKESNQLIIYSPLTESMIDSMISKFEEETGIDVECLAMGTGDALKRIQTEVDSPQADVLWSGTIGTVKQNGEYFAEYVTPNEDAFYDDYKNVEGNLTRFDTVPSVIMVNTDLIGDIEINGYEDLLNPELKGKIAFADPAASSSSFEHLVNMLYAMGGGNPENGWDYVTKLCEQLDGKLLSGSSAVYKGVADGEYVVGLTFEQGSAQYVAAGSPVKTVYMEEGVIFRGDGVYIIKNCPNEANAQKFIDWLTTQEVQEFMNNTQFRRTIRSDVPAGDAMEPMENIKVIKDDEADTAAHKAEWLDQFKDIFTQ